VAVPEGGQGTGCGSGAARRGNRLGAGPLVPVSRPAGPGWPLYFAIAALAAAGVLAVLLLLLPATAG
jgi:hypothetical protein